MVKPPSGAVDVSELSYSYQMKGGSRQVLSGLSFSVGPGEIYGLLGPNGSGKSTTFHILSTFLKIPAGSVSIFGADPGKDPDAVRRLIGVVFQNPSLDKSLTVEENLCHQGHLYGMSGMELSNRIAEDLARVGMTDRADELTKTLSGGLKRRAELAKGILHRPKLLLLDEPSTGLDPGARKDMWEILESMREDGTTILLTTHWMEEAERCDRLAILNKGEIVVLGTPDELKGRIGGDVISMESGDSEALAKGIREKFNFEVAVLNGTVRMEISEGHTLIPKIAEAFPGQLRSITLGKPTLEDVFIRETGHTFHKEGEE